MSQTNPGLPVGLRETMQSMDFPARLASGPLLAAGALGTSMLAARPGLRDGCIERLVLTEPDVPAAIQHAFFAAGCDAVDALTFGANPLALEKHDLGSRAREMNRLAAEQLNAVRDEFSTAGWPRFSIGSIGPGVSLPSRGEVSAGDMRDSYREQVAGLVAGNIDVLKVETCRDLAQARAALDAITDVTTEAGRRVPVIASVTLEPDGRLLTGVTAHDALEELAGHPAVDVVGFNCCRGPEDIAQTLGSLGGPLRKPLFAAPNAGLPVANGNVTTYPVGPAAFAARLREFVQDHGVGIVGGCCGTTPEHMEAAAAALRPAAVRPVPPHGRD